MPRQPTAPLGGGRPSYDVKQIFKLSVGTDLPKRWRHLSIIALAALVATMTIDSKSVATTPTTQQVSTGGAAGISQAQAQAPFNFMLPTIQSVELPPVPVRKEGVKEPAIAASHVLLLDNATKLSLYEKSAQTKISVASTTKIVTALTALEHYRDLNKTVSISSTAVAQIGSGVGFRSGETATLRQLLYGLMLVSGNDAAIALAEQLHPIGGDESANQFINKMNERARQLGMNSSHFLDPAGLNDSGYSTAADMVRAMSELLNEPELVKMIGTLDYQYNSAEGYLHNLKSSNRLIGEMYYEGIIGGKTGFTPKTAEGGAGHCLVAAATRNGHTLIAAVFDTYSNTPQASAEVARQLLDYGFNSYSWQTIRR